MFETYYKWFNHECVATLQSVIPTLLRGHAESHAAKQTACCVLCCVRHMELTYFCRSPSAQYRQHRPCKVIVAAAAASRSMRSVVAGKGAVRLWAFRSEMYRRTLSGPMCFVIVCVRCHMYYVCVVVSLSPSVRFPCVQVADVRLARYVTMLPRVCMTFIVCSRVVCVFG